MTYAGFWKRFAALLIDGAILSVARVLLLSPFGVGVHMDYSGGKMSADMLGYSIISTIVTVVSSWLYYALMESSEQRATLGKMAIGIHVTDLAGNRISFARASGRYFARFLSGIVFMIGYLMAAFTEKKQALHDIIAGTLVVNDQPKDDTPVTPSQV